MATGVYCIKTLQDNWFEDRCQPEGGLAATDFNTKTTRPVETELANITDRYDVLGRISRYANRASYATPDDGFRIASTTSQEYFINHGFQGRKTVAPKMIHTGNAPVLPPERRPLEGPQSGFGASLPKHEDNHEQRFWETTSGFTFGEGVRGTKARRDPAQEPRASGVSTEYEESRSQGLKVGKLCGETFNDTDDISVNTRCQRAWRYDGAIANIHLGGQRPKPPVVDNHLSLPLGEGQMKKVRADLKERQGRLGRTGTAITKGANKSGQSIFNDD